MQLAPNCEIICANNVHDKEAINTWQLLHRLTVIASVLQKDVASKGSGVLVYTKMDVSLVVSLVYEETMATFVPHQVFHYQQSNEGNNTK